MIEDLLRQPWLWAVVTGAAVFLGLWLVRVIACKVLGYLSARTDTKWDDLVVALVAKVHWSLFAVIGVWAGWNHWDKSPSWLKNVLIIASFIQIIRLAGIVVEFLFEERMRRLENQNQRNILQLLALVVKLALYVALVLSCLDTMGINVTTLVAGLGIGGIAIALAVQNILSDFLSSMSIILDRPFEVGDTIELDTFIGTIEKVGIKTTRARSITGEEIVFPNSLLLQGRIRNYRRMQERRVSFIIGVTYDTSLDKVRAIPSWVKAAVEAQPRARFERAHFASFAASSLDFEIIYWVKDREFLTYRDVHQEILLAIGECFRLEGVDFAFPSQTLYVANPRADGAVLGSVTEGGR